MRKNRLSWQEELEIVDRTMKAISSVTNPEELVDVYWSGIGELVPIVEYVSVSRRNVDPPFYLVPVHHGSPNIPIPGLSVTNCPGYQVDSWENWFTEINPSSLMICPLV